ncbi:hypothetical protein [Massilia aquatica]|uniref:DUF600 family protein n=1 Tax=Massilia aquatica TaxID=2609000 RepID=A0ABX0MJU2_9BURK|nr:hypothetical protein [Massilia aquatica]NHZ43729.1 hypothetical protein [Massilia aquatica]
MAFQNHGELVNQAVQGLADTAPSDWRKIVFYLEFLEDEEIGLRNKYTGRVFGGENFDVPLSNYGIGGSLETFEPIEEIYLNAAQNGDRWTGILLTLFSDGQFKCRFYYENSPLLYGDDDMLEKIISEGVSDSPR